MSSFYEEHKHNRKKLLGRCSRCNTDGECDPKLGRGHPDWDFNPGDICEDRPYRDEEIARARLADSYFSVGNEIYSFWDGNKVKWLSKRCGVTDNQPSGCTPSLDCTCNKNPDDMNHPWVKEPNNCPDHGPGCHLEIWGRERP